MRLLAVDCKFSTGTNSEGGRSFTYRWPGMTLTCNEMPGKELPRHLDGFCGYVRNIYRGKPDERGKQVLDRIKYTRLVVGVALEPGRDEEGRAEDLLGTLANGLKALLFFGDALYDPSTQLILAPDGSFDPEADVLGPVADMIKDRIQVEIAPSKFQPTSAQAERYQRVLKELRKRKVPTLAEELHIEDDDAVTLRSPSEVARRALILSAITLVADTAQKPAADQQAARRQAHDLIERVELWPDVSPEETAFLKAKKMDQDKARKLLWRLEDLWVLEWALGNVELPWPAAMCDVPRLTQILISQEDDPDFVANATLLPRRKILDAAQLTMLLHWAIRDAWIHKRPIPADLDWTGSTDMVAVNNSAAVGVVEERHHALNWLIRFADADWDDVDTPT